MNKELMETEIDLGEDISISKSKKKKLNRKIEKENLLNDVEKIIEVKENETDANSSEETGNIEIKNKEDDWKFIVPHPLSLEKESYKKDVKDYYENLNEYLGMMKETENKLKEENKVEKDEESERKKRCGVQFAIYASFLINVGLLVAKIIALLASGSNSILASVVDSFLDLLAGSIIFITNYFINKKQIYLYPAGKSRIEPLGIIVFSALMFMLSFFVVLEGARTLSDLKNFDLKSDWVSLGIIIGTIAIKIFLCIYCKIYAHASSSVSALADDHRNDILTNGFGLAGYLLGSKLSERFGDYKYKMIDPIFAILLALFIMRNWFMTGKENLVLLSGKAAPKEFVNLLTFLTWNHHPKITHIDTVRAFHMAERHLVEIDIILDENMPLKEAHNIGESLQTKIEELDEVERCYVHLDYEYEHAPEHKQHD